MKYFDRFMSRHPLCGALLLVFAVCAFFAVLAYLQANGIRTLEDLTYQSRSASTIVAALCL